MYARPSIVTLALLAAAACSDVGPSAPPDDALLAGTLEGLSGAQVRQHVRGDEAFGRIFGAADGLGPIFVAESCERCHAGDGKGHPLFNLTRFGRMTSGGFDPMRSSGGPQIQSRALPGMPIETVPTGATGSAIFMAPAVTGLGLLEAVPDAALLANEDPDDLDGDGISGRVQLVDETDVVSEVLSLESVLDGVTGLPRERIDGRYVGRFGKKASAISLLHQTVTAYREDMGITSDILPTDPIPPELGGFGSDAVPDPEISSAEVQAVVFYLRTLRPPPRRNADAPEVLEGEALFAAIGCARCHLPAMQTGPSAIRPLDRVTFHPYTDLLLHDMGPELDDGYTEGRATTAEWRTAPLWGIGVAARSQGGQRFLLHDGRARTLAEAIGFHGGEGAASRAAFGALTPEQQARLFAFLESL